MPWASDGIVGYEAYGQWTAIVGTGRADGEVGSAAPSDQDSLAVGVALHHAAVGELGDGDALRKVGAAQFLFFCHWFAALLFFGIVIDARTGTGRTQLSGESREAGGGRMVRQINTRAEALPPRSARCAIISGEGAKRSSSSASKRESLPIRKPAAH